MFSHSKKEHIRNDKKCSEEIRTDPTFQVKITTELLGVFDVKVLLNIALMCGSSSVPCLSF